MFNKPSVFGRNDPVTRRDASPTPGSSAQSTSPAPERSPVTAKSTAELPSSTTNSGAAPAGNPAPASNAPSPLSPATLAATKESSVSENVMGARLIVGPDVKLRGAEILDCDTLVVEGRVEATMDSRVIRIAENGSFSGKVSIDIAEIHGIFEGELTARSQLIIHSTGRVSGTIRYGKLVADEGGVLCGDINVISANEPSKPKQVVEPFATLSVAAG